VQRLIDVPEAIGECKRVPGRQGLSPLTWLSAICLDAPVVAVTWQWLFASAFGAIVALPNRLALFLTAWLIYLADRFADCVSIAAGTPMSARQRFCAKHQAISIVLILLLVVIDSSICLTLIEPRTRVIGSAIAGAIAIYLALNHFAGWIWQRLPVKEMIVGFLFASGTLAPINCTEFRFVVSAILFGILCSLNCLSISVWERDLDIAQGKESFATGHPQLLWLPQAACLGLGVLALGMAIGSDGRIISLCLTSSAIFLAFLNRVSCLPRDERVALADIVLLTPLVVPLFHWFA
jgi:hypothetical protein